MVQVGCRYAVGPGRYSVSIYVYRPHDNTKYLEADTYLDFEVLPSLVPEGRSPYTRDHGIVRFVNGCRLA